MNTKLYAVTDTSGRPIRLFITAGQVSDYTGAAALMNSLPKAEWLLADQGYDADWFREVLVGKGTTPCIQGCKSRKKTIKYTSGTTKGETGLCQCSAGSKTGFGSLPATIDLPPSFSPPLLSPHPSSSGYES